MHAPIMQGVAGVRWTRCANCKTFISLHLGHTPGDTIACNGCPEVLTLKQMTMVEWDELESSIPFPASPVMFTINPRTKHREAIAAKILFLDLGISSIALIAAVNSGRSMVERLDACSPGWNAKFERKCAEADAARELFVEHGFSSQWVITESSPNGWGLLHYANFEKWKKEQPAQIMRELRRPAFTSCPPNLVIDMKRQRNYEYGAFGGGGKTAAMIGTLIHEELAKYCQADIENARAGIEAIKQGAVQRLVAKAAFKLGNVHSTYYFASKRKTEQKLIKDQLAKDLIAIGVGYTEAAHIIRNMVEGLKNV